LIINQKDKFFIRDFIFLLRFKIVRIHFAIRLRSSKIAILRWSSKFYLSKFLIEVGSSTKIGESLFLPHPRCIIISDGVVIGDNVHIGQYVTIGGSFKKQKFIDGKIQTLPIIGNKVMIMPGAVIGGPVTIGDEVIIGANSVVTKDIPSNRIVIGQNNLLNKKIHVPSEGGRYEVIS